MLIPYLSVLNDKYSSERTKKIVNFAICFHYVMLTLWISLFFISILWGITMETSLFDFGANIGEWDYGKFYEITLSFGGKYSLEFLFNIR